MSRARSSGLRSFATEAYAASQACGFQEPTVFILVAVAPRMSLIACKFASSNFCIAAIVFGNLLLSLFRQPRAGAARSLSVFPPQPARADTCRRLVSSHRPSGSRETQTL
jgi:hypothetical protein